MKILFVCAFLGHHGGFESYVESIVRVALEDGHTPKIITPGKVQGDALIRKNLGSLVSFYSAQESWRATINGWVMYVSAKLRHYIMHRSPISPKIDVSLGRVRAKSHIAEYWERQGDVFLQDADLIHLFGKPQPFVCSAIECAFVNKKKIIYTEVAAVNHAYLTRADHNRFPAVSNKANVITVLSKNQVDDIVSWYQYHRQVEVLNPWVFDDETELLAISQVKSRGPFLTFGSLCRLSPEKGLSNLIAAFAQAHLAYPFLRLKIAGIGDLEDGLRQYIQKLKLETVIELLGFVENKLDFYSTLDVFVVNSMEEGGPITVLEAMASGLPIISTPVGGVIEWLGYGSCGIITDDFANQSLVDGILRIIGDDALRQNLGFRARERYLDFYRSKFGKEKLLSIWNTLI